MDDTLNVIRRVSIDNSSLLENCRIGEGRMAVQRLLWL